MGPYSAMTGDHPIITIVFLLIYFSVPFFCYRLFLLLKIDLFKVSIPSILIGYFFLVAYVGLLPLYFGFFEDRVILGVIDKQRIFAMLLFSGSSIILMLMGMLIVSRCYGICKTYDEDNVKNKSCSFALIITIIFILTICTIITLDFANRVPRIALLAAMFDVSEAKLIRSEMTNAFKGPMPYHYYSLFMGTIMPFCVFVLFSNALNKKKLIYWIILLLSFFITAIANVLDIQKAPIIWLIGGCIFVYYYDKGNRINLNKILAFLLPILLIMILLVQYFMGVHKIGDAVVSVLSRVFTGAIIPAYFYLEIFPEKVAYLWGRSLPNPREVFPWEHYKITVEVMNYMVPRFKMLGIVGSAPTTYWAELYANFGFLGPIIISPYIGAFAYLADYFINRLVRHPVKSALLVWMALHLMKIAEGGISFIDLKLVTIIFLGIIMLLIDGKGRLFFQRNSGYLRLVNYSRGQ